MRLKELVFNDHKSWRMLACGLPLALLWLIGCGNPGITWNYADLAITPRQASVRVGATATFQAMVESNQVTGGTWSVEGGPAYGAINADGVYKSPASLPENSTVTIDYSADGTVHNATVSLLNPTPNLAQITPSSITSPTTCITAIGSGFVRGSVIFINGAATQTEFVDSGHLSTTLNMGSPAPASFTIQIANPKQVLMDQAMQYNPLKTVFPTSTFAQTLQRIAQLISGRSVLGASKQIFYTQQTGYDTHVDQMETHAQLLQDLDSSLGAFFAALDELGMTNQVLVCTHSDFCRSMACNTDAGSDHAWASHQLILGGGIRGGRILGTMPDLELGGSSDVTNPGIGMWLPTTSVTQMAAGIGNWLGLTSTQLSSIFPDLANFPSGVIQLS